MPHEHVTVHSWRQVDLNKSVSSEVRALARARHPTCWQLPFVEKVSILGNVNVGIIEQKSATGIQSESNKFSPQIPTQFL